MKVYIASYNMPYEGGDRFGVYSTMDLAIKATKEMYGEQLKDGGDIKSDHAVFSLGYDYITIEEDEVIGFKDREIEKRVARRIQENDMAYRMRQKAPVGLLY